jgi:hypothetical protein
MGLPSESLVRNLISNLQTHSSLTFPVVRDPLIHDNGGRDMEYLGVKEKFDSVSCYLNKKHTMEPKTVHAS